MKFALGGFSCLWESVCLSNGIGYLHVGVILPLRPARGIGGEGVWLISQSLPYL